LIEEYFKHIKEIGFFDIKRKEQNVAWMHHLIKDTLTKRFFNNEIIKENLKSEEAKVALGIIPSIKAARNLLAAYDSDNPAADN
jgi:LAO/AO transport system kinase